MSINVFISHSTGTIPEHIAFRRELTDWLRGTGFDVFVDEDNITAGAHWRDVIFGKLADCNAAVILVNERALSCSDWVDTEARLVCWRAWIERKNFRVILIPFGGVTRMRIAEHKPWQPLALAEVQMVPSETLDIADANAVERVFDEIAEALQSIDQGGGESWIVEALCSLLPKSLQRVAKGFDVSLNGPDAVVRRSVAKAMYEIGPAALKMLIDLLPHSMSRRDRSYLLELLSTHWIDPRASTSILRYCDQHATDQIFAINGAEEWFTPQAYIQQLRRSTIVWPVIRVDKKRPTAEILGDIRSELRKTYEKALARWRPRADEAEVDENLNELLRDDAEKYGEFVFVVLPPAAINDADLIKAIHEKWKWIRIVACTGTATGESLLPNIPMIEPELDTNVEIEESSSYRAALRYT